MDKRLPNGWKWYEVQDIADVIRGASPRPKGDPRYYGGNVPRLMVADVTRDGKFVTPQIDFLTNEGAKLSRPVPAGTLAIVCSGVVGVPSILAVDSCIQDGFLALKNVSEVADVEYLYYAFSKLQRRFDSAATHGGVFTNLTTQILKEFVFALPPLHEQGKIAEILNTWDTAIELMIKQIEAKQQLKKGLMQQLLLGKMRFPGFSGKWNTVRLEEVFNERNENNPSLDLLSITGDEGVIPRDEVGMKDTSNADKSKYKVIMPGDIGYNTMRMWQGRSAVSRLKGIVSPAYTIVTPRENQDVDFYGYLFQLPQIIHLFYRYSQGLVSDTWSLKFPHFSQIRIRIPESKEQQRISNLFLDLDREIELMGKKVDALEKQKQGLMQKLLTGEVRVKV